VLLLRAPRAEAPRDLLPPPRPPPPPRRRPLLLLLVVLVTAVAVVFALVLVGDTLKLKVSPDASYSMIGCPVTQPATQPRSSGGPTAATTSCW